MFGPTTAREFGSLAFKRLREALVKRKVSRGVVNDWCGLVKRITRWAVENELPPADRWEVLRAVRGLTRGRTEAPEPEPVGPVLVVHVDRTAPFLNPVVWAMARVQLFTGMRPGEICRIRPCEIDRNGSGWLFTPQHHKTKWKGRNRTIPIGKQAQEIPAAFSPDSPEAFYFNARQMVNESRSRRSSARRIQRYPSQIKRNDAKRKVNPQRHPAERYSTRSYSYAIARAVEKCNAALITAGVPVEDHLPHWSPNQFRHTFATRVRKEYGLEAAQVMLDHARADVTQIYAERNLTIAVKVATEIG